MDREAMGVPKSQRSVVIHEPESVVHPRLGGKGVGDHARRL
jgi:hypothetical protein